MKNRRKHIQPRIAPTVSARSITPDDLLAAVTASIPDYLFEVMNDLLIKNYDSSGRIIIRCDEFVGAVVNGSDLTVDYPYNSNVLKNLIAEYEDWEACFIAEDNKPGYWTFTCPAK